MSYKYRILVQITNGRKKYFTPQVQRDSALWEVLMGGYVFPPAFSARGRLGSEEEALKEINTHKEAVKAIWEQEVAHEEIIPIL
jgi:hypothetical protein